MGRIARAVMVFMLCILMLAACGSAPNTNASGNTHTPALAIDSTTVALVTASGDGDQDDNGFNQLANAGYLKAVQQYGFPSLVFPATTPNDDVTQLTTAAEKADMVIVVGSFMQTALDKVAKAFPEKKFAMVDGCAVSDPNTGDCENLPNVASLLFNEQEAGCLVGALAAQMEVDGRARLPKLLGKQTIGAVGSQPISTVDHYIVGYTYCAKKVDPHIRVVVSYSNDFTNPGTCQALAEDQITEQQADIIFQVASSCGIGVLNAAAARNVYSIGVDTDQSRDASGKIRPSVITSAIKRVDTAVYAIITEAEHDQFDAFVKNPFSFDLIRDGVGFASPSASVPQDAINKAQEYENKIKAGELVLPL